MKYCLLLPPTCLSSVFWAVKFVSSWQTDMEMLPALMMMVREALDDKCSASGRAVHGPGFLSSTGSVVLVMTELCSLSRDDKLSGGTRRPDEWKMLTAVRYLESGCRWSFCDMEKKTWFVVWGVTLVCDQQGAVTDRSSGCTWLVGSPRRLQMWGTILLSVRLWDPNLKHKTQQEPLKKHELTTDSRVQTHELFTHTLSVEMRQRQSPSLVRLFLCLKPPIIRSHTNWKHRVQRLKWSDSDRSISRWPGWRVCCAAPVGLQPGPWSSAGALGPGPGLGPWSLLIGRWGSAELRTHGQK